MAMAADGEERQRGTCRVDMASGPGFRGARATALPIRMVPVKRRTRWHHCAGLGRRCQRGAARVGEARGVARIAGVASICEGCATVRHADGGDARVRPRTLAGVGALPQGGKSREGDGRWGMTGGSYGAHLSARHKRDRAGAGAG